jgi:hypothetical protein
MSDELEQALRWALDQNFTSVSARYAKLLAQEVVCLRAKLADQPEAGKRDAHTSDCAWWQGTPCNCGTADQQEVPRAFYVGGGEIIPASPDILGWCSNCRDAVYRGEGPHVCSTANKSDATNPRR